ncbi:Sodium/hydrogen exchanger [Gracilaria domingensis]|nr:Sodium/hydrogen exchanger [Gracilaria domingensis]
MLSATDPISVTATLKSLGASEALNTLIEGESLVNDGSAFVLWEQFFENAQIDFELSEAAEAIERNTGVVEETTKSAGEIVGAIFKLSLGGMVMGVAFGLVALIILSSVYDEFEVETSLTVIVAFLGFWTAQAPSKLSGVIANVASGLVISAFGRHLITPAVRGPLAEFWELLGWIANTIVFVHAGVLLSAFTWSCAGEPHEVKDYAFIIVWYLYLQLIRMGLFLLFRPILSFRNKWLGWKEAFVVGFSGLRGAVSLILALEVAGSQALPEGVKSRVVLWTTGIVALSLLVNGFLVKPVIHVMKLDRAEKSREEFMLRARAVMVQRTLQILDNLCVESGYKSARWSYVIKNVLPAEWLDEAEHVAGYRNAVEQLMDNAPASTRVSLEHVRVEERNKILHTAVNHRLSQDIPTLGIRPSPTLSPGANQPDFHPHIRTSMSNAPFMYNNAAVVDTPRRSPTMPANVADFNPPFSPISIGIAARPSRFSLEGGAGLQHRRSIDADVVRYATSRLSIGQPHVQEPQTAASIQKEIAQRYRDLGEHLDEYEETEKDREVRRRLLTAILSHVRAINNASLVEYSVLINLEEDVQRALDANEEGLEYDLFSFLDFSKSQTADALYQGYLRLIEGKKLRGEASITTTVVVFGILTSILKEEMLFDSPKVLQQAEKLYEGAATLLNRLEALNPYAFGWVNSQFAIYMTEHAQDSVLSDLRASGVVDEQEHKVIHEELIEVRRKHVRSRQSLFSRSTLPPIPKPRALLREHPLFASLSPRMLSEVVDRYGVLVHLKGGQALQAEKGSLVLVLQGAIRPLEDQPLPNHFNSQLRRGNLDPPGLTANGNAVQGVPRSVEGPRKESSSEEVSGDTPDKEDVGVVPVSTGSTMHWCFPSHNAFCGPSVILHSHSSHGGNNMAVAQDRTVETQFGCCEIANSATVFTLPVLQVKQLARSSEDFRLEITRSLAREIVLESVSDQRPYVLTHFMQSASLDITTVVGRAFRVLERLPYMSVIALHAGEQSTLHLQGPGVLLNGTVRVSIVDTSGLVGAVNLLHEELTGPALLPAGGLILQETTPREAQPADHKDIDDDDMSFRTVVEAATTAADVLEFDDDDSDNKGRVVAHVLIEAVSHTDHSALQRLRRWTMSDIMVDMNGRFGMYRHVELASLMEAKVE